MAQPAQKIESKDELLQSLFRSNHQLGVVARFASEIAKVTSTDELTKRTEAALMDFGLSGLFKVSSPNSKYVKHFGNSIKRDVFDSIECLSNCGEKICAKDNFILFRLTHLILILDATSLSLEQVDETKDNLAIFTDIIDAWMINYVRMKQLKDNMNGYKDDLVQKIDLLCHNLLGINDMIQTKHHELSQDLTLKLSARFLTLGLEPDQEEEILGNVEFTNRRYGGIIDDLVTNNTEILHLMTDMVEFLKQRDESEKELEQQQDSNMISNDDNIVLF